MTRQRTRARQVVLFVEGESERALPQFFHKWLDPQLPQQQRLGIRPVKFQGVSDYLRSFPKALEKQLDMRGANFVFGLLDLYRLPNGIVDRSRFGGVGNIVTEARQTIHQMVPKRLRQRFRQHFAVHELEAWLLAYPKKWPAKVQSRIAQRPPEEIDFDEPPAKFLRRLLGGQYKKTVYSKRILSSVNPQVAIDKCPYLRRLAEDMLEVAKRLQ